jgi:hypothetical protein
MKKEGKIVVSYKYLNDNQTDDKLFLAYQIIFDEMENILNVKTYENNRGLNKT